MVSLRRLTASLGALVVVMAAAACLVFDGRVATDLSEGGDAPPVSDAADAPRGDGPADGSDATASDGRASDALASDGGTPGRDGGRVICGARTCAGGSDDKCCAKWDKTEWVYSSGYCHSSCMQAGGYYDYECDDNSECDAGQVCCAFREDPDSSNNALTTSMCESKSACTAPGVELCSHGGKCMQGGSCVEDNGGDYLPPKYWYCK
jgi:hypothetical protein